VPITDYCDQKRLKTRERLELFVKVCEGVPHAHRQLCTRRSTTSQRDSQPSELDAALFERRLE
jgi:hypothetical protein